MAGSGTCAYVDPATRAAEDCMGADNDILIQDDPQTLSFYIQGNMSTQVNGISQFNEIGPLHGTMTTDPNPPAAFLHEQRVGKTPHRFAESAGQGSRGGQDKLVQGQVEKPPAANSCLPVFLEGASRLGKLFLNAA